MTTAVPAATRSNSAKRSASGNLSNSSDDEQDDQIRDLQSANRNSSISSSTGTISEVDSINSSFESPCSPGGSSTSSGPVYVRPPGFIFHAQEVTRSHIKKKKKVLPSYTPSQESEILKKREPTPPRHRQHKRDPLPMRMRAFPQSFWHEPNKPVVVSPAHCHKVLPPLALKDEIDNVRPVTPTEEEKVSQVDGSQTTTVLKVDKVPIANKHSSNKQAEHKVIVTSNADILLSKLFENAEKATPNKRAEGTNLSYKTPVPPSSNSIRRGRPKNMISLSKTMIQGCDPYMVDTIADKLFPHLTLEKSGIKSCHQSSNGNTSLQLVTLREGDKSVTLPSLCVEQNYSQMLSELVPHL